VTVPTRRRERAKPLILLPTVDVVEADLRDPRALAGLAAGHDAAVNLVGVLHGPDFKLAHVELAQALVNRTSILVGQSGVGKSSLINRLLPVLDILIGKLSEASGQGRHTTTATTLYHLPQGGNLIDSPGVRDFRLGETAPADLARGFREFRPYLGLCQFQDCRHLSEPGCAVKEALREGVISERRLASYTQLANGRVGT